MTETKRQYKPRQPKPKADETMIIGVDVVAENVTITEKEIKEALGVPNNVALPEVGEKQLDEFLGPKIKNIKDYACYHCQKAGVITTRGYVLCGGGYIPVVKDCPYRR